MNDPIILLHDEALRANHPVFTAAPINTQAIYIWDDEHLKSLNYSLKRLIFIYETMCELPIDIISGNTIEVIEGLAPARIYFPSTNNPLIVAMLEKIATISPIEIIADEMLSSQQPPNHLRRFSQYWKKIEKNVMQTNGGSRAEGN